MLRSSSGKLGILKLDGRQVGGFLDWEIQISLYSTIRGNTRVSKLQKWTATARKFWMLEQVTPDRLQAIFYCFNGDLRQVSQNQVTVRLPNIYPLREMINKPLVMYG